MAYIVQVLLQIFTWILSGLGFSNIVAEKRHENKEKLKKHFEELKQEAEDSIFSRSYRLLSPNNSIYMDSKRQGMENKDDLYSAFKCHFGEKSRQWEQCIASGRDHNKEIRDFEAKLKNILEEKTGLVVKFAPPKPYVHDFVITMLWYNWGSLILGGELPFDFAQATIKPKDSTEELKVEQYLCGVFSTSEDTKTCISALIDIQNNFYQEAANLHRAGEGLVTSATSIKNQLRKNLEDIEKYQLGKKFKKVKKCPVCQKF